MTNAERIEIIRDNNEVDMRLIAKDAGVRWGTMNATEIAINTRTLLDAIDSLQDKLSSNKAMLAYILCCPENVHTLKYMIFDLLNGCTGANNIEEIHAQHGTYDDYLKRNNEVSE